MLQKIMVGKESRWPAAGDRAGNNGPDQGLVAGGVAVQGSEKAAW